MKCFSGAQAGEAAGNASLSRLQHAPEGLRKVEAASHAGAGWGVGGIVANRSATNS